MDLMDSVTIGTIYKNRTKMCLVVAWMVFKKGAKSEIAFVGVRMSAQKHIDIHILGEHVLSFMTISADNDIIFQPDSAPIHTAASKEKKIKTLGLNF